MFKLLQNVPPLVFLVIATSLEVSGDALVRISIQNQNSGMIRVGIALAGAVLLFGYGFFLNLAPVEFSKVVGLYIATLFIVWQLINFMIFRTLPTAPVLLGGALVVAGGLIITFWKE